MTIYLPFNSETRYEIKGRGTVFVVANDRECYDFAHLLNQEVMIDGTVYLCRGVERFAHLPPWRKGEKIGLLVST